MVRRIRTNTATAALVTLNDPVYTEAAQAVARQIVSSGGANIADKAAFAWRRVTGRPPQPFEAGKLARLFEQQLEHYRNDAAAAHAMATDPLGAAPAGMDEAELAAWTVVAATLLNLDEVLTKG